MMLMILILMTIRVGWMENSARGRSFLPIGRNTHTRTSRGCFIASRSSFRAFGNGNSSYDPIGGNLQSKGEGEGLMERGLY